MSHSTDWYQEGHVILTTFSENLTIEELRENDAVILDMVSSSNEKVHLVIDVTKLKKFPTKVGEIRQSAARYLQRDNMGWLVVIGFSNPLIRFLSSVITQLSNINLIQVDSIDEAITRLQKIDPVITVVA